MEKKFRMNVLRCDLYHRFNIIFIILIIYYFRKKKVMEDYLAKNMKEKNGKKILIMKVVQSHWSHSHTARCPPRHSMIMFANHLMETQHFL